VKLVLQIRKQQSREAIEAVFDRLPVLIGRSKICDLVLDDAVASRQHCVLETDDQGRIRLVDLESANGTSFRGKKIAKEVVQVGDEFKIGDTLITIEKAIKIQEESTSYDATPAEATPIKTESYQTSATRAAVGAPRSGPQKTKAPEQEAPIVLSDELTLKTPVALRLPKDRSYVRSKDWVQVSLFWQGELIDIKCFDRGEIVSIGKDGSNDFVIESSGLPDRFPFLKIHPQGVEVTLHPSMKGLVETRGQVVDLETLRQKARPSEHGSSTFFPFQDRCLFELGPFSFFIRSVKLKLAEPLETPLIREPLFATIFGLTTLGFLVFLVYLAALPPRVIEESEEDVIEVTLAPTVKPPDQVKVVKPPPPPPPPPPPAPQEPVKVGPAKQKAVQLKGREGEGARAKGEEGQRGRETGRAKVKAREIGILTKKPAPKPVPPRGAMGKQEDPNQARAGLRPDRGTGTGKPKDPGFGRQAASPKPRPKIRVEDEGLLGVLGSRGGGGRSATGDEELAGTGLGGREDGQLEQGLERGALVGAKGFGGRGNRGRGYGGGGDSIEVGGLGTKGKGGGSTGFGLGSSGEKGEAEVSYTIEEVEVRDGLTREEIERVVRANQSAIRACYDRALIQSGNLELSGRLVVAWFVNTQGRAQNVQRVSPFGSEAGLFDCISRQIQSWQFPKPRGGSGAQVSFPFVFQKGG
jgi:pSer/pThr/pTyr-binding forkhead associated (FHA) protein